MRATIVIACLAVAAPAYADDAMTTDALAAALGRHSEADIDALRAHRDEPSARCTLGAVYAQRGDLSRAQLYLNDCEHVELDDAIGPAIRKHVRETRKAVDARDMSVVEIVTRPAGVTAEITALAGETFTTPASIWVAPGTYEVRASHEGTTLTYTVTTKRRERAIALLELPDAGRKPTAPTQHSVDFSDETATAPQHAGQPPDVKRPTLVPEKYRRTADPNAVPVLEDPLATRTTRRAPRTMWLGLRAGAGMFDDGDGSARIGAVLAANARFALDRRLFIAARLDWSRRGGALETADATVDTLGMSAGIGATLVARRTIALAAIAQLRADLRFADERAMQPVSRAGASAAAALELAFPTTPITAALRVEHGLTPLADTRDRALLLELGVDLR